MQITTIPCLIFLSLALACSSPRAGMPKEAQDRPTTQREAPRPPAKPTERPTPMRVGGEVSAPKLISRPKHPWPNDPTQCYQLGVAVFEGVVDRNGDVTELRLIKGPDNEFTRAAREAMARQKFDPALYRGKPVDVIYHATINHVPIKKVKGPC